jgi:hypothetical protein
MVNWLKRLKKMVDTIKISQFPSGGAQMSSDLLTGLRTGANTNFMPETPGGVYVPLPFTVITSLFLQMVTNNGYAANNAGQVTLVLPVTFAVGDIIEVAAFGAGGFQITQNAAQQIVVGIQSTTIGITGTVTSTQVGDSLVMKGIVANTSLMVIGGVQGNLLIV